MYNINKAQGIRLCFKANLLSFIYYKNKSTSLKLMVSTNPLLVSLSSGSTARAIRDMVINGETKSQPSSFQALSSSSTFLATSSAGSWHMSPAIGRGRRARTFPSLTATIPPPTLARVLPAKAISSSLVPTIKRLWESWATVEATAPDLMWNPLTKPLPMVPVA